MGSAEAQHADVRIVTATNRDPKVLISQGKFREDLYYRLSGVRIYIPPLRERPDDIPILAAHFAKSASEKRGVKFAGFSDDAIDEMLHYHWPGNVRELRNLVETAVVLSGGAVVRGKDLMPYFEEHRQLGRTLPAIRVNEQITDDNILHKIAVLIQQNNTMLHEILSRLKSPPSFEKAERDVIIQTLKRCGGSRKKTAQQLGISTRTLYRKMKKYGIK